MRTRDSLGTTTTIFPSNSEDDLGHQEEYFAQPKKSTKKKKNDDVLLDSGSTISIFKDEHLVDNIRTTKNKIMLYKNVGKKIIDKEAGIPGHGSVYYDESVITNLYALKDIISRGRVQFDSVEEDAFNVLIGQHAMKFAGNPKGLYILKTKTSKCFNQVKGFSQREISHATKTRRLYHQLASPSQVVFKTLLRQNIIGNCDVVQKDIALTEKIFGPNFAALKGKSTCPKPRKVVDEEIQIPNEFCFQGKKHRVSNQHNLH